jgi:hypothetical protein
VTCSASADRAPLLRALAELPGEESFLLRRRYGIGASRLSEPVIARRLGLSITTMAEMEKQALAALGLFLIAEAGLLDAMEPGQ